jgi:hypothetical protein
MSDNLKRRGSPVGMSLVIIGMILAPVLYVLSIGPALWLLWGGPYDAREQVFGIVYAPVVLLANYGPSPITDWLTVYINWWTGPL